MNGNLLAMTYVITPNVGNIPTVHIPSVEKTNDGPSTKQNIRYEPKASTSAPKKVVTNVGNTSNSSSLMKNTINSSNQDNITSSNSFVALNEDVEEGEVENVFDETANLFNSKTGGRSSFMAAVVKCNGFEICYIDIFWPYDGSIDDLEVFGLRLEVDLRTVSRSRIIVGVFNVVDFSFDLLHT
ncbi:hypothetical protein Tco_0916564, partial [Tanacetum coccineum]